jgi:molybdenum cofactor cytidylyltransferase
MPRRPEKEPGVAGGSVIEGEPLDCVVLAAGASTRMGKAKIHLPFAGRTIVGTTAAQALDAGLRVILVARPDDEAIGALGGGRVLVVRNPDPGRGMLSSIKEGIRHVSAGSFFFIPADMPFPGPEVYRTLAERRTGGPVIPVCGGRRGHPVLLPASLIPSILALPLETPLKLLIEAASPLLVEMAEDSILRDIDTVEDYERALAVDEPMNDPLLGA